MRVFSIRQLRVWMLCRYYKGQKTVIYALVLRSIEDLNAINLCPYPSTVHQQHSKAAEKDVVTDSGEGPSSGAPYPYRKVIKETHELIF